MKPSFDDIIRYANKEELYHLCEAFSYTWKGKKKFPFNKWEQDQYDKDEYIRNNAVLDTEYSLEDYIKDRSQSKILQLDPEEKPNYMFVYIPQGDDQFDPDGWKKIPYELYKKLDKEYERLEDEEEQMAIGKNTWGQ